MKQYLYRVRPGYGSKRLLIEFSDSPDNKDFSEALKNLFKACEIETVKKEKSFDDVLYSLASNYGFFEMSVDSWGGVFIHADDNQVVIGYLDKQLTGSGVFKKEVVDFSQYESEQGFKGRS